VSARPRSSAFGAALQAATGDPSPGLYNETAVSLGSASGLRVQYAWGFYTVCAYTTDPVQGSCSNSTFAHPFAPFAVLSSELPVRYQTSATFFISNAPGVEDFINSSYFTTLTQVSFYLLFLGTITSAAVFVLNLFGFASFSLRIDSSRSLDSNGRQGIHHQQC